MRSARRCAVTLAAVPMSGLLASTVLAQPAAERPAGELEQPRVQLRLPAPSKVSNEALVQDLGSADRAVYVEAQVQLAHRGVESLGALDQGAAEADAALAERI